MVLCHSRMLYVEFTVSETMEHFLACHANAFAFFGGVPAKIMVDNLKSAALRDQRARFGLVAHTTDSVLFPIRSRRRLTGSDALNARLYCPVNHHSSGQSPDQRGGV